MKEETLNKICYELGYVQSRLDDIASAESDKRLAKLSDMLLDIRVTIELDGIDRLKQKKTS